MENIICVPLEKYEGIGTGGENEHTWKITSVIGEGVSGTVWQACSTITPSLQARDTTSSKYVLKYIPLEHASWRPGGGSKDTDGVNRRLERKREKSKAVIKKEIGIQQAIAKFDMAVPIIDSWFCETGGVIIMRSLKQTVESLLKEYKSDYVRHLIIGVCLGMVAKLQRFKYYHGDAHLSNIMVDYSDEDEKLALEAETDEKKRYSLYKYKYYFIDFGRSGNFPESDAEIKGDYVGILSGLTKLAHNDDSFLPMIVFLRTYISSFTNPIFPKE
jgi:serine/threonine protein kinase